MKENFFGFSEMSEIDARNMSPVSLAFVGDGVYTLYIRTMVAKSSTAKAGVLHKTASSYVKAESQAKAMLALEGRITDVEEYIFKRGRNAKTTNSAKNASMIEYKIATGFEALLGYLYLTGKNDRLCEILHMIGE
ncbi:MAG: ribonuclease III domain-containing protein [Bacillota bacterium]